MLKKLATLGLIGLCALALNTETYAQGAAAKADGGGIKWSTKKVCTTKIPLSNGDCIEFESIWQPYLPQRPYCYVGYEVELTEEVDCNGTKVSKIKVWVAKANQPHPVGEDPDSWCHAVPFGCGTYSPGGEVVPAILKAGYDEYDWDAEGEEQKKGDVLVFCSKGALGVGHSAEYIGDGKYCSKNRYEKKKELTKAQMQKDYPADKWTCKCYREKPPEDDRPDDDRPDDGGDDRPDDGGGNDGGTTGGDDGSTTTGQIPGPQGLGAAFYTQQADPSRYGKFHQLAGTAEYKYVEPDTFLDYPRGLAALEISQTPRGYELGATLTIEGLEKVERAIENSPHGPRHPIHLVQDGKVQRMYNLGDFMNTNVSLGVFDNYEEAADLYWNIILK